MNEVRTPPTTIAEYIGNFPRPVQLVLKRVRSSIRKALPRADESISYGIPTYKLNGRPVIYFAGLKHHYSIYPANARLVAAFKRELTPYEFNGKGTIRFPLDKPVPTTLIEHMATFLVKEVAGAVKTKTAKQNSAAFGD
jgi:uncharacterized protein YdhG (YjbR/CyaY superfamily)